MDILQKKYLNYFPSKIKDVFKAVKFMNYPLDVIGSSSFMIQKFYGDIDINVRIPDRISDVNAYTEFKKIYDNILNDDDLYFIELKIQDKDGEKIKFKVNDPFTYREFLPFWKNRIIDYVKIDLVAYYDNFFIEISINYYFNLDKYNFDIKDLEDDIKLKIQEGNYLKAIKRKLSIYIAKRNAGTTKYDNIINKIINFLNSDVGFKYQVLSNMEAIQLIKDNYDDELTMKRIKNNEEDIGRLMLGNPIKKQIKFASKYFFNNVI